MLFLPFSIAAWSFCSLSLSHTHSRTTNVDTYQQARGQQANITPEQIQAQAQAMVQAAAQAQAVVAAAKSRGGGLQPMNSAQIAALSQVQARAIVNARKSVGTPEQIQTQIQLQTQALVHAHTQAQINAGIYKGEVKDESSAGGTTSGSAAALAKPAPAVVATPTPSLKVPSAAIGSMPSTAAASGMSMTANGTTTTATTTELLPPQHSIFDDDGMPQPSATSPQFLAQLNGSLDQFWRESLSQIQNLEGQTEQDFKNHNDLPLARIKRIMKSDEDVRMISAEAPVLFAKACELFILDLSIRAWNYSQLHKRRTLQKEDVREAILMTDIFDFLVDLQN